MPDSQPDPIITPALSRLAIDDHQSDAEGHEHVGSDQRGMIRNVHPKEGERRHEKQGESEEMRKSKAANRIVAAN